MKNIFKSIGWIVLNIIVQFIVQMAFSVVAARNGITDNAMMNEWLMNRVLTITIISNFLFVMVAVLICKVRKIEIRTEWKIEKVDMKSYVLPCVIAFTYSMFYSLIMYDAGVNASSMINASAKSFGVLGIPVLILALLISAPITEEILCRGIMMNTLKRTFSAKIAIVVSSLLFGIMHIMAGGIGLAIGAMIMGLVLAIIYEKSNSLYVAIVAHAVANLPEFILYSSPQINNVVRIVLSVVFLGISVVCLFRWCIVKQGK